MGRNLLSLQHFLHTPNSLQLPLKTTHHAAHSSHTSPQGCFVHCWNVCVERCLQLHPIRTMHTGPIHKVPAYTHWPNSHFPHGWRTIMCPPYTLSINILSIFPHPGTATHVPNPVTSPHLDTVTHLVTHILE